MSARPRFPCYDDAYVLWMADYLARLHAASGGCTAKAARLAQLSRATIYRFCRVAGYEWRRELSSTPASVYHRRWAARRRAKERAPRDPPGSGVA